MSALPEGLPVPDSNGVFLAISAGNYYAADMALWTVKAAMAGRAPTPAEQAHLGQLRQRRKDTYADLVAWVMVVEAERLRVSA